MNFNKLAAVLPLALTLGSAFAIQVPRGTEVPLVFDKAFSSKTIKTGDSIPMHVSKDVMVNGKLLVKAGTHVTAVVSNVSKRGRWGKNAKVRLTLNPVKDVHGHKLPLQPRQKGSTFKGGSTGKAALLTGAGAVVLGPIGLAGGYFIPGKEVKIKAGDPMDTEVSADSKG